MSTTSTTSTTSTANTVTTNPLSGGAAINFTGLASGLDTSSIVSELISIERAPVDAMQLQKDQETSRQNSYNQVSSLLQTLRAASDNLRDSAFWAGTPTGTSGESGSYSISVGADAPKASYQVQVKKLATGDVWTQTASSGVRGFGASYIGNGWLADSTAPLTTLTNSTGASLGLAAGTQIQLSGTQGGSAITPPTPFTVTATSTLDDLRNWVQTSLPGSTVSFGTGGRMQITSPAGTDQEIGALALSTGGTAPGFDAQFATSTATATASGLGKVQADDVLHLTAGTLAYDVAVKAGWTMTQVAQAINGAHGSVQAGVTNGKLRLSTTQTGATEGTIAVTSTGSAAANMGLTRQVQSSNAIVNVDGADIQSESNTATNLLPGATIVLKASSTSASTATTDPKAVDKTEATNRMQAFVDAYNAVFDQVNALTSEATVPNAQTAADKMKGLLFNSSTLTTVKDALQNAMIGLVQGLPIGKSLASDAGISTGAVATSGFNADALTGKLTFDSAKFGAMFDSDPNALKNLFGANGGTQATDGFAQRISDLTDQFTSTGGMIAAAIQGSTDEMRDLDQRIQDMNDRIAVKETTLKAQFTAMEQAISQLKSASSSLTSILGSTTSTTGG